jgi:hypothetical protein
VVDEIGYQPVVPGGGNLFFQLVNARYVRVSRDREHGFHCIVSKYFAGS